MIGTFILSQDGQEVARLIGELITARASNGLRSWDLFLKGASPGLMFGGSTTFDVTAPNGKVGKCIATRHSDDVMTLRGTGPAPI